MKRTTKKISENRAKQKASDINKYAQESYPAVSSTSVQTQKVQYYSRQLLQLLEEKENISKQMIEEAKPLFEFEILTSFPGIGEISAALYIGEIGDLSHFSNHKKINAIIVLDIRKYKSGKYD